MFDRFISIDWSGAGTETDRGDLRVVEASPHPERKRVVNPIEVNPTAKTGTRNWIGWTREECKRYLTQALGTNRPRCLIAMDFGFGYPWIAGESLFACEGWEEMLGAISRLYAEERTARAAAHRINLFTRFGGHGPYRFDDNSADFRFYLDNGTPYYRLVEIAIPQAKSQWYLGSGSAVGFSSITGMAALRCLMEMREKGEIDFHVWPQEGVTPEPSKHVLVESYPAIYPDPHGFGDCGEKDEHCQDAWKVLQWMLGEYNTGMLERYFQIPSVPFGRVDVCLEDQIRFEGWIFGVS